MVTTRLLDVVPPKQVLEVFTLTNVKLEAREQQFHFEVTQGFFREQQGIVGETLQRSARGMNKVL